MQTSSSRPIVDVGGRSMGGGQPFVIAGPCVLEHKALALEIAAGLSEITSKHGVPLIFKASFDKANRTSLTATRGPGLSKGLELLGAIRASTGLPTLTDVHLPDQCEAAAEVVDILQIPAFLCRQTDLLLAAAATGRTVNVKKGQFLAPWDMVHVTEKLKQAGNPNVMVTERGTSFGYGRLVVDMTGFEDLARTESPIVFDATHSVQRPGEGGRTGGDRSLVPGLARAAAATGRVDGFFFEVHPEPDSSPSDAANIVRLDEFEEILAGVLAVHAAALCVTASDGFAASD